jgi:hypothetical protein
VRSFVEVAAGTQHSYFLADDGVVVKTLGGGEISRTFGSPTDDAAKYASVGSQGVIHQDQYSGLGAIFHYLIRADGSCTRIPIVGGEGKTFYPDRVYPRVKYIDCAVNEFNAYIVRSDGAIDRFDDTGVLASTIPPPEGTTYTSVKANRHCSYFLRADGKVDRTEGWGKISATYEAHNKKTERGFFDGFSL